jgi:hypothetical protein
MKAQTIILIALIVLAVFLGVKKEGYYFVDEAKGPGDCRSRGDCETETYYGEDACNVKKDQNAETRRLPYTYSPCIEYTKDIDECFVYWSRKDGANSGTMPSNIGQWYFTFGPESAYDSIPDKNLYLCGMRQRSMPTTNGAIGSPCVNDDDCTGSWVCDMTLKVMKCKSVGDTNGDSIIQLSEVRTSVAAYLSGSLPRDDLGYVISEWVKQSE